MEKELKNILNKKLFADGGITFTKELKEFNPSTGYMVSEVGFEFTFSVNNLNIDDVINKILEYKKLLKNNCYIGLWIDNNLLYIDISKYYTSKQKAILQGIKNKQIAIYDYSIKDSLNLTKKVYTIYKYNKLINDISYYKEFYIIDDVIKEFNLVNKKSIYNYIINDIEDINSYKNLLNNKYIIITEDIPLLDYNELIKDF